MKTDFRFSNLLGTVYCQGNLAFSPDGTHLFSPVGNRVTVFNLVDNKSHTLPFAHRKNIVRIGLSPRGNLLLTVDEDGHAILTNVPRRVSIYHFSFKSQVTALSFSPSGRYFVVGLGRKTEVWHVPSTPDTNADGELEFAPFVKRRTLTGHFDAVQHIEWSSDSRFFLTASKDLTARIWSVEPEEGFIPTILGGHKQAVIGAWFSADQETIYTVSKDGAVFAWKYVKPLNSTKDDDDSDDESNMRWRIVERHYFMQGSAHVRCAYFHAETNLLVAGMSNGLFSLYEMPDFNNIHKLSISQSDVDFVTINKSGEWLAFGASKLGQLLVWEWQSESYILKQQGHFDSINSLVYSPDGQRIITTADDGKVKVWDIESGFCIVTFTEHTSGVTASEFAKKGNVLFTSSLDGSVRAWDLIRYRNFRTFTAPTRLSFTCMAVDPSGEVVAAGSLDSFDIHIWSVQTGQLLDRLAGHEGPVSSLAFTPNGNSLAVPPADIPLVVADLPIVYVPRLLRFVAAQTEESPHLEFCLLWIKALVDKHGAWLTANRGKVDVELRVVSRAVVKMKDEIRRLADENVYMVDYLLGQADKKDDGKGGDGDVYLTSAQQKTVDAIMNGTAEAGGESEEDGEDEWMGME
ncbi:WD40 repeat-like protein [Trichoderma longibrachiatum ATCC 18648]|uniref:WD40 repeat-like protein n=1 Tax=Trichoderma longibrachiatum ATCC 18648 TaxID=983965 RepID=A0A2T4CDZ6_TRILO|nr:WD40 repeat-like protein [Trichoderma longibrachiatum ATCC 18648]